MIGRAFCVSCSVFIWDARWYFDRAQPHTHTHGMRNVAQNQHTCRRHPQDCCSSLRKERIGEVWPTGLVQRQDFSSSFFSSWCTGSNLKVKSICMRATSRLIITCKHPQFINLLSQTPWVCCVFACVHTCALEWVYEASYRYTYISSTPQLKAWRRLRTSPWTAAGRWPVFRICPKLNRRAKELNKTSLTTRNQCHPFVYHKRKMTQLFVLHPVPGTSNSTRFSTVVKFLFREKKSPGRLWGV